MKVKEDFNLKEFLIPYIATTIGSIITAVGVNAFFIPHHLLSGGIGGVSIIFYYLMGLPIGVGMFILNIPIMIACYKYMGRSYTVLSIVGTVIISVAFDATAFLTETMIIKDPFISSVTGGVIMGVGMGVIYKYNGNSGGLDVVGAIVKKFYSLEMGNVVMILNGFILAFAAWMFTLELAVLTFVGVYVSAFVTNKVVVGLKQRKSVVIITNHGEMIAQVLMRYIGHGATFLHGQGAYTMQDKQIIYVIIKLTEVSKVKDLVNKLDPQAFMIISDASEVVGQGFTRPMIKKDEMKKPSMGIPHTKNTLPPEY